MALNLGKLGRHDQIAVGPVGVDLGTKLVARTECEWLGWGLALKRAVTAQEDHLCERNTHQGDNCSQL